MTPLVTVVVVTYNNSPFLRLAIQSALAQTFDSYEILVTDNSNSDETRALCASFQNPKIRYRSNPTNIGMMLNFAAGIGDARGKYVSTLCDDDEFEPEFLEKLVPPLEENPQLMLTFSDHSVMSADGKIDWQHTNQCSKDFGRADLAAGAISADDFADLVLVKNGFPMNAAVYRKEAIDLNLFKFGEVVGTHDFWLSCLIAAAKLPAFYIPEKLTRYRIHDRQYTALQTPKQRAVKNVDIEVIFKKLLDLNFFQDRQDLLKRRYGQALFQVGKDELAFDLVPTARKKFLEAFEYGKSIKSVMGLISTYLPKGLRVALKLTLN